MTRRLNWQFVIDNRPGGTTLAQPDVRKRFVDTGAEAIGMTPAEFLARIKNDAVRYRRVVEQAGVKPG
jgi:tripartite-type tricarboxylate transporter receptor subunit TctC